MPAVAKSKRIETDVLAVLSAGRCDGSNFYLSGGQLDRKLYLRTNEVLEALGCKWTKKAKAHVFDGDAGEAVEAAILTGEFTRPGDMGWFPTPQDVADKVAELAEIETGHAVLEPSAGLGSLLDAIVRTIGDPNARHVHVTAVEIDAKRCHELSHSRFAMWVTARNCDFLTWKPDCEYDRVVMNPPFAPAQADIDHVLRAYDCLKAGGKLVSVMAAGVLFRENKKTTDFRKLVDEMGSIHELPEDSFKASGTGVNTVIVVLDR